MSLLFGRGQRSSSSSLLEERTRLRTAMTNVSAKRARQHSVVWAAQRLRADLISILPIDVYRKITIGGETVKMAVPAPPVLIEPWETVADSPQHAMPIGEWMFSSQIDLDTSGNFVGIVHARDANGLPTRIEPVPADDVAFRIKGSRIISCRIAGEKVELEHLWHERQYTVAGLPVGLSPLAYAALTLQTGLSAQEFAFQWFSNGAAPSAHLRNVEQKLDPVDAERTRRRFIASQKQAGDVFVSGKDWEYTALSAKAAESGFVDQAGLTNVDLCRFLSVPADMVDVPVDGGSSMTYANIVQRNLQLLVMNLGASIKRRDDALSRLTAKPRFVKLNRSAILAMDDKSRAELFALQINSRTRTPDEVRAIDDEQPHDEANYAQFDRLFGARTPNQPQTSGGA